MKNSTKTNISALLLTLLMIATNVHGVIVDIDSSSNTRNNPVEIFFEAGTYLVVPIGRSEGGLYNARNTWGGTTTCYNSDGCPMTSPTTYMGWNHRYNVISPDIINVEVEGSILIPISTINTEIESYFLIGDHYNAANGLVYPNALNALANAQDSKFTLTTSGLIGFATGNSYPISDDLGGISLNITPITETFDLTISTTGSGQGAVKIDPLDTICNSDCTQQYQAGTTVTLTALPVLGSSFLGWTGACSGIEPCQVKMDEFKTVTARFISNLAKISGFWDSEYDGCFTSIAINPVNPAIIYIGCSVIGGPGVLKSTDFGQTWVDVNTGIEKIGLTGSDFQPISKIEISSHDSSVLYLGTSIDNPLYTGGKGSVYKSSDGGDSWVKINGKNWLGVPQIQGSVFSLAIDPNNSDIALVGAAGQGVYKTTNSGIDWAKVYDASNAIGKVDYFNVIKINPLRSNEIYISGFSYYSEKTIPIPKIYKAIGTDGVLPIGLKKSVDGGATWETVNTTATSSGMPLITDLNIASSTVYLSAMGYRTPISVFTDDNGIYKSIDKEDTWISINDAHPIELTSQPVYSISLDSTTIERLLISSGHGAFYSIDSGDHWQQIMGLPSNALVYKINSTGNRLIALTSDGIYLSGNYFGATVRGDTNCDSKVDIIDIVLSLQTAGGVSPTQHVWLTSDVNGDGRLGVEEAIYTMRKVSGLLDSP